MYAIYICFSSWSKRSELRKESEETWTFGHVLCFTFGHLDMCSASEADKELIRHEVRVSYEQTYVRDFRLRDGRSVLLSVLASKLPQPQGGFCFSYL